VDVCGIMARRRLEAAIQAGKVIQQGVLSLCNIVLRAVDVFALSVDCTALLDDHSLVSPSTDCATTDR